MHDILLVAINARYSHTSHAIRTLRANLPGALQRQTAQIELTIQDDVTESAWRLLSAQPRLIGLSVYLWNVDRVRQMVEIVKSVSPGIFVVLGGPEVQAIESRQADALFRLADACIVGEGEIAFGDFCQAALSGQMAPRMVPDTPKIIHAPPVDLNAVALPYDEYTDDDLRHRVLYVESSRGCPYACAFCLSAKDKPVRTIGLPRLFEAFKRLLARGARHFKFLDRTLNASLPRALAILDFFMPYCTSGITLHFEMVPQDIPPALLEALAAYPPAVIQIEFGVQTLNPEVARTIRRPLDDTKLLQNLQRLRLQTQAHIHADLIAGLPGEDMPSFARGFERLLKSGVQEIQLGILKRLKGSPLDQQAESWGLAFSTCPPYEILHTPYMTFEALTKFKRFAKFWDTLVNNASFPKSVAFLCAEQPFERFWGFTQWVYQRTQATHSIAQARWVTLLFEYMTVEQFHSPQHVAQLLIDDYLRSRKEDIPPILRPHLPADFSLSACKTAVMADTDNSGSHIRQQRHRHPDQFTP